MNKIMELAYHYAAACERRALVGRVSARLDLATEVQTHIDYTRAVIAERDALQKQVQEQALQIISLIGQEIDYTGLRKAAQMALEALETCTPGDYSTGSVIDPYFDESLVEAAEAALRMELGQ